MPMPEEFLQLAKKVNNWGRWGDDDELGTLNLITPEVVKEAASLVKTGKRLSLAIPLHADGPQTGAIPGRSNPIRTMTMINAPMLGDPTQFCTSDDVVFMGLQAGTHWDSLAHASYDNRLYNGVPATAITSFGASKFGVQNLATLVSRGVLLDIPRAKGVERLDGGYALTPDDLDAAEELAKTKVGSGDVVLVRTGQMQILHAGDKVAYGVPCPGPSMQTVEWFHSRDVAAVATDNLAFEVYPPEREDIVLPVHLLNLVEMGMTQGQNFDLEALAADCADDGVYEFFLSSPSEPFVGGVGTPTNPVAIK